MIPRRRASVVCVRENHVLAVRLREPGTGRVIVVVPGGGIEAHESPTEAAIRETVEETGLSVRLDPTSEVVRRYPPTTPHLASQVEALWVPLTLAEAEFGFHDETWRAMQLFLRL